MCRPLILGQTLRSLGLRDKILLQLPEGTQLLKIAVVVFPGTNCDADCFHVITQVFHQPAQYVRHDSTELSDAECVILPGGFSYGDYLRAGAIARFSPIMTPIADFARAGGQVVGICNGFQALVEAGLLPGALLPNSTGFRCEWVNLLVEENRADALGAARPGQVIRMPIAHGEGRYYLGEDELSRLERNRQVVLRYCGSDGQVSADFNPNGSVGNVAAVCNEGGNVFGLMPHPERCSEQSLGGTDGRLVFQSLLSMVAAAT